MAGETKCRRADWAVIGRSAAATGTWWWRSGGTGDSPLESSVASAGNCAHTHTRTDSREEQRGRGGPPTGLVVQQVKEECRVCWGNADKQQLVQ